MTDMLFAVTLFTFVNASVKWLSHIPFYELVFFRALVSLVICYFLLRSKGISVWGNNKKLLLLRGLAGTAALSLFFFTLQRMPLASAVTVQYLNPIFTVLLAGFMVKEWARPVQWIFFLTAFAGVVMVKGFDARVELIDVLMGITAALGSGIAYNIVRMLKKTDHELVVVFYFPLVTVPIMGPYTLTHWVAPQGWDWLVILGLGVFTQMAQVYMTKAFQKEKAANVSIINYLGVVYALIVGYFLFGETLSWGSLSGILLIVVSVIVSLQFREKKQAIKA